VFALPYDAMTFLPNFFFGALVMWIGQDILKASHAACANLHTASEPWPACINSPPHQRLSTCQELPTSLTLLISRLPLGPQRQSLGKSRQRRAG
jgi:hypothetical protein